MIKKNGFLAILAKIRILKLFSFLWIYYYHCTMYPPGRRIPEHHSKLQNLSTTPSSKTLSTTLSSKPEYQSKLQNISTTPNSKT